MYLYLYNVITALIDIVAAFTAGAGLLTGLTQLFNNYQIGRRTPGSRPAGPAVQSLGDGYEQRVKDIGSGRKATDLDYQENLPPDDFNPLNPLASTAKYAGNITPENNPSGNYGIHMNPNADEAYLAHEMGHVASQHTDVGKLVRQLRDNPKLTKALIGAGVALPAVTSALEAGDDDLDTSLLLASAAASPVLIDEALATKNGLAIMNNAGRRASLGQRGKLAGGYLSYLAPVLLGGAGANLIGNQLDQDV